MPRKPIQPPVWWNQNLYSFVQNLPPEGWVWEFKRRAELLRKLRGAPVDAMNPNPNIEKLPVDYVDYLGYYKTWSWYREKDRFPVFLPPAVTSCGWPRGFHGQQYRIKDHFTTSRRSMKRRSIERRIINVKVDLNRTDRVINRDFSAWLELMRNKHPEPKRMNPRFSNWPDMHILEVWDLRQFKVSWREIVLAVDQSLRREQIASHNIQSVRNAYNSARSIINGGKWLELALRVDAE